MADTRGVRATTMRVFILIAVLSTLSFASDKADERFSDRHRKAWRNANHIDEDWAAYCVSTGRILGLKTQTEFGCVVKPPDPPKPATPPDPPKAGTPKD